MSTLKPKYPIYIPSRNRSDVCLTANFMVEDGVEFKLVVVPSEVEKYAARYGKERLLVLPSDDMVLMHARNWIREHAQKSGAERHWQFDDNIRMIRRIYRGKRLRCNANPAIRITEDFIDRYDNVAIAGFNYTMFTPPGPMPPFCLNVHVYSATLFLNKLPNRWRCIYNDDTDICLQVLSEGWCTVLFNAFTVDKMPTMTVKGGNTTSIYTGDGRLKMARSLERIWPHVVSVDRRFRRPQHVVRKSWKGFDTQLRFRKGYQPPTGTDEHGLTLGQVRPIKAKALRKLVQQ